MSDRQRSRVYATEDLVSGMLDHGGLVEIHGSSLVLPTQRRFGDVAGAATYLDRVLELPSVARLPRAGVGLSVRERRGSTKAHYELTEGGPGVIALPPHRPGHGGEVAWALRETVVLHELAHHLHGALGHGAGFTAHLLHLWDVVFGAEATHLLRIAMSENAVEIGVAL